MMYYRQIKRKGRVPMMDYVNTKTGLQMYGKISYQYNSGGIIFRNVSI